MEWVRRNKKVLVEMAVSWLACCDLRQKCYDLCYDIDLKNHSVLPTLLRLYDLQGDHPHLPSVALRKERRPHWLLKFETQNRP